MFEKHYRIRLKRLRKAERARRSPAPPPEEPPAGHVDEGGVVLVLYLAIVLFCCIDALSLWRALGAGACLAAVLLWCIYGPKAKKNG